MQRKRNLRKAVGALIVTLGLAGWAFAYVSSQDPLGRETLWLLPMLLAGLWVSYSYWSTEAPGPEQDFERRGGYTLVSIKHFKGCPGIERYQASWLKR